MRAALVASRLSEVAPTGLGRYARELASAIARVAAAPDEYIVTSTPEPGEVDWAPAGLRVERMRWPRRPAHLLWTLGAGPTIERSLGRLDVVHLLHPFPPVPAAAPIVATIPDLMAIEHPESSGAFERRVYKRSVDLAVARAEKIIVHSDFIADHLAASLRIERARIATIPHGVNERFSRRVSVEDVRAVCDRYDVSPGRYVVYVGNVSTRKNLLPVIKGLASLGSDGVPLLVIGASAVGASQLESEIERLDLGAYARRTGYLDDEDVAALVQSSAMLVHPSLGEGFGLTVLEAMAAGVPVVAARAASLPEVIGDAGILVDEPLEPDAWARAIADLLADATSREAFSRAGRERAALFTWEQSARSTIALYRDVVENSAPSTGTAAMTSSVSPAVSVIIPTRNRVAMLEEAVASVDAQTASGVEIVVVDDASDDGTKGFLAKHSGRIRVVELSEHLERSAARNRGLEVASAPAVLFLDDDDRLVPTALHSLREALVRYPGALASVGAQIEFARDGHRRRRPHPRRLSQREAWPDALFHWVAQPSRTLFRTDVIRELGGFNEAVTYGEDWELWLRVTRRGPVVIVPDVVSEYRAHPAQSDTDDFVAHIETLAAAHERDLSGDAQALSERIRQVRSRYHAGHRALSDLDAFVAARHFAGAVAAYPRFLLSPVVRPSLVRPLGKALVGIVVGRRGTVAIRRLAGRLRKTLKREVARSIESNE